MGIMDRLRKTPSAPAPQEACEPEPAEEPQPERAPAFDVAAGIDSLAADILVITPLYPTKDNPYGCAFVHNRVLAYRAAGLQVAVACKAFDGVSTIYEYEGVTVHSLSMADLLYLLQHKHYRTIAIHFIENDYARVLESCDLSATRLLVWCHAGETLYWDRPLFTTPYFSAPRIMPPEELDDLHRRDAMLARFNEKPNTTFVFVSDFVHERASELTGITWNSWEVIPNRIDFEAFPRRKKDPSLGAKVFTAKTQLNTSNYAMDIVVRTILELSRRECFERMSFTVVGAGDAHDMLLAPLRDFGNVRIIDRFLSHDELAAEHASHGVALFPTRFDAQGVSMCEAAASGLAVVSSKRDSVAAFLSDAEGLLVPTDDHVAYADTLQRLCEDAAYFEESCDASYRKVSETCAPGLTIEREVALLADQRPLSPPAPYTEPEAPLLTLAPIGASQGAIDALRLLAAQLGGGRVNVLAADSAMQAAQQARGTYVRLLGPQDMCDPEHLEGLLQHLAGAQEDVVLTDWWQLAPATDEALKCGGYHFMVPGQRYSHDDLALDDYGFGQSWPGIAACTFNRAWLAEAAQQAQEPAVLDELLGDAASLASSLSYCPLPAYYAREQGPTSSSRS